MTRAVRLLASVGAQLRDYDLDLDGGALVARGVTEAAEKIDYACADAARRRLYAISSNGRPGVPGDRHWLQTFALERGDGDGPLREIGPRIPLEWRALHIAVDGAARHLFVTHHLPGDIEVWRLAADGTPQMRASRHAAGHFTHQLLLDEERGLAIAVARGTDATAARAEEPGSLQVFDVRDGVLTPRAVVAPNDGYGFGPRNAALHPHAPWLCVSLERQSRVCTFALGDAGVAREPAGIADTLAEPERVRPRQLGGALAVHPGGRYVYVANRADHTVESGGQTVFGGGENSFAVFALDPRNGALELIEHVDSGGCYPRTFSIDRSGTRLVVANGKPMRMRDLNEVPANLALFGIAPDGRLTLLRRHALGAGAQPLFWSELLD